MDSKFWLHKLKIILFIIVNIIPVSAQFQNQQEDAFYNMYLEDLLDENEDQDLSEFLNHIDELRKRPLNLNSMKTEDFKALIFLNAQQINNFFQYKSKYGNLKNLHELQAIAGFDLKTIKRLTPLVYISVLPGSVGYSSGANLKVLQQELMLRSSQVIQKSRAYVINPRVYLGSSNKFWLRYKLNHEYFKLSILYEKDPGEPLNPKYNHRSFSFQLQNIKFINKIIIGDFNLKYGQGLGI